MQCAWWGVGLAWAAVGLVVSAQGAQQEESAGPGPAAGTAVVALDGVVLERQKYSFTLRGPDGVHRIRVPNNTPIAVRLARPQIDFGAHTLSLTIPFTAPDHLPEHNQRVEYAIPDPLYIKAWFEHARQRQSVMAQDIKPLANYDLMAEPLASAGSSGEELVISGQLAAGARPETYLLRGETGDVATVRLGQRAARLVGQSILQLEPHKTIAFVQAVCEGDDWYALEIEVQPIGDALAKDQPGLPRLLCIGDVVSLNYQRPLAEALRGKVNVHHPPVNCGGSECWRTVHHWMGAYDEPGRQWDVVALNFGLWDETTEKAVYQENLRRAIAQLSKSGARLIWVTSTPISYAYNTELEEGGVVRASDRTSVRREVENPLGLVPGRTRQLNQWAAEVIADYPDIAVCDLWSVVAAGEETTYREWWYTKDISFNARQAVPLAEALAQSVLDALGR